MIIVSLNNEAKKIAPDQLLGNALASWGFNASAPSSIAIAVNQTFVPRTEYAHFVLNEGDEIDVVQAISGG